MNKRLILLTLSLLTVTMLQAQNIIRPKVECPNGIYVNSYNGVLFYQRPDVSVANRNMRLEAVFYYNSSSNRKNYGYGNGWSLGSELRFVNDSLGVIIEQGDGRQDLYTRYGNSFEAPAGVFSALSFEGDGYLLTYKDGTKYYFTDTVSKKVTQVKDRYDNAITYTYQEGNLATASDISGRSLYFAWSNDLLSGISTSFDDRTWSYQYDENGNLTAVTDPMGYTVHYAYNKDNRIKTFTDAEGYSTHISYNTDGMAHRVKTDLTDKSIRYELAKRQTIFIDYLTDANNQYTKYVWDEQGRLVEIENVNMGTSTKFAYDDDNNLVYREDANGNAYIYTYDENGNRTSETDPLGYTETYTYESSFNKVTSYTDKMGHYYNYQYDEFGDLLQMNGPLNYTISLTYNQYGQPLTVTDANGNVTHYVYDNYGNRTSKTDPLGNVTTYTYNLAGMILTQTEPNGAVTTLVYDNSECLVEAIDAFNFSTKLQYDRKGNLIGYTDALNNTFTMSYDAIGQIVSLLSPNGSNSRYGYIGKRMVAYIDANNNETTYQYDDNNRIIKVINPNNKTIQINYDNIGNIVEKVMPNGQVVTMQYDAAGRVVSSSDQLGTFYVYQYDGNGNVIQINDELGNPICLYYDALNRLIQIKDAMNYSEYFTYDNNGNLITYLDKNGNAAIYSYDANGNCLTYTDAMNNVTYYVYDANGDLLSITDANGASTTYEYDLKRKLKTLTFPDGRTRKFWYDAIGNKILQENEAGEQVALSYDANNRLIAMNCVGNSNDDCYYTYDFAGRLTSATNQYASSVFSYDREGRLLSESTNGLLTSYAYNDVEGTISITYPSGQQLSQKYDVRSRLSFIKENNTQLASFMYDNANRISCKEYANGVVTNYFYDANGHIVQLMDNQNLVNYEIEYDAVGNLVVRKDNVHEESSQVYTYDALNRLINYSKGVLDGSNQIPNPAQNTQFVLDGLGNRVQVINNGEAFNYTTNTTNAYTSIIGDGYSQYLTYDDKGNLSNDGTHTFQYDYFNRLVSIDEGNSVSYKYDALGRMVQRQTQTLDENFVFSGNRIIENRNSVGELSSSFIYGQNSNDVISSTLGTESYYLQKDQFGSTIALIDNNAAVREQYSYDPYGNTVFYDQMGNQITGSSLNMPILYGGHYLDDISLSYQISERNLQPSFGRFSEKSALVYAGSMNNYEYHNNNPLDPSDLLHTSLSIGSNFLEQVGGFFGGETALELTNYSDWLSGLDAVVKTTELWETLSKGTASFEEEVGLMTEYAGGILIPAMIGAAIGSVIPGAGTAVGFVIGLGVGLVLDFVVTPLVEKASNWVGSKIGKGMDIFTDIREEKCEQFKQNGYANSSIAQQTFADVVNHPLNVVGNAWNLGKRLFNYGYGLGEKWFPVN